MTASKVSSVLNRVGLLFFFSEHLADRRRLRPLRLPGNGRPGVAEQELYQPARLEHRVDRPQVKRLAIRYESSNILLHSTFVNSE